MVDKLLVRIYNVGLGDCIYLRVPDSGKQVHILIDCGNKFKGLQILKDRLDDLKNELPDGADNKKKLDLLVVTHPHEDHFEGIDDQLFEDFDIQRVWLSPAFNIINPDPEAKNYHALQGAVIRGLKQLSALKLVGVSEMADGLLAMTKEETVKLLCKTLPDEYNIQPNYVTAETPEAELKIFNDDAIKLKVLAPMKDIDRLYLGGKGLPNASPGFALSAIESYDTLFTPEDHKDVPQPENISVQDFAKLRDRVTASALALVKLAGKVTNNLSVILLLEWGGLRLLFPADAEFKSAYKGKVKENSCNGSWNVMWEKRTDDLKAVDFLKVGHHGSVTATPWIPKDPDKPEKDVSNLAMNLLLNSILPLPEEGTEPTAIAIISTERTTCWPSIPDPDLMEELGKRVEPKSRREYTETYQDKVDGKKVDVTETILQPLRTDLEVEGPDNEAVLIDCIEFEAESGGPLVRI